MAVDMQLNRTFDFSTFVVLVHSPSEFVRGLLSDMCRALHLKMVMSSRDYAGAKRALTDSPVDIIIGDISSEDGCHLLKDVRDVASSSNPHVPFIATSLKTSASCITRARDCGATEFLAFPLSACQLIERMMYVVENPRVFVNAATYKGPDRRRKHVPINEPDRRKQGHGTAGGEAAAPVDIEQV
jgi:DNA-binding NtrC family response regulator